MLSHAVVHHLVDAGLGELWAEMERMGQRHLYDIHLRLRWQVRELLQAAEEVHHHVEQRLLGSLAQQNYKYGGGRKVNFRRSCMSLSRSKRLGRTMIGAIW